MSLPDLLATLEAEVDERAASIIAEARATAERIAARAGEHAATRRAVVLGEVEREARAAASARIARHGAACRRQWLTARARFISTVTDEVRAALPGLVETEAFREQLGALLQDALGSVDPGGGARLRCSPSILSVVRDLAGDQPGLVIQADAGVGSGFLLEADGGRVTVDATLEARLQQMHGDLAMRVAGALADDGPNELG